METIVKHGKVWRIYENRQAGLYELECDGAFVTAHHDIAVLRGIIDNNGK